MVMEEDDVNPLLRQGGAGDDRRQAFKKEEW
jgi:hypothetical protein